MKHRAVLSSFALFASVVASASDAPGFTENKGQIHDQFRKPNPAVLYLMNAPGMNVQLRRDGFAYDTYLVREGERVRELEGERAREMESERVKEGMEASSTFDFHRIDIRFVGGDANAEIIAVGQSEDYTNYYTDVTGEAGATYVRSYTSITYRNLWPNIDVRCNATEEGFKYDVIVRPGGRPEDVRFSVTGATIDQGTSGELEFTWSDGKMQERIPRSWIESGRSKSRVSARYVLKEDGQFGFAVDEAFRGTLVIDPYPTNPWATYCGSIGNEAGYGVALDASGNSYMVGETSSTGVIATSGTHDATFNGGMDAFMVKYDPTGIKLWGTYCGGTGADAARDVTTASDGTLAICGNTSSNTGIATTGAHQVSFGGGSADAFLVHFQANGTRTWGSYLGGAGFDLAYGIAAGMNGELAICGRTGSISGIAGPVAADAVHSGGTDAFVALYTSAGVRTWSTYLGGAGNETAQAVTFTGAYPTVCGTTTSTSAIATSSAFDASHNGLEDAFIARYHSNGAKLLATYFGGAGNDAAKDIAFTMLDRVVIVGSTASTTQISTAGCAQPVFGGGNTDGFIAAFNLTSLHRVWSTYCGGTFGAGNLGSPQEWLGSIAPTTGGDMVVAGPNFSTDLGTPDSWSPVGTSANGSRPSFVAGYSSVGGKQWAGYPEFQKALAVAADANCVIVAGSGIAKSPHIPLPNAYQPNFAGGTSEAFIQKLDLSGSTLLPAKPTGTMEATVVDGTLKISEARMDEALLVTIHDAGGRELLSRTWSSEQPLDLPVSWRPGVYIVTLRGPEGWISTTRIIIP